MIGSRSFLSGLFLAVFTIISFTGCQSQPMNEQEVVARLDNLARIQIPLDPKLPGARASDTKNYYVIFDGSGSMGNPPNGCTGEKHNEFKTKLQGAQWAMKEFLKKVPPTANLGMYVFHLGRNGEKVPLGIRNREQLVVTTDEVRAGGGTPLAKSIRYGTDQLVKQYQTQLGQGEYALIVVTDGEASGIPEAAEYTIARGIQIYTIGLCIGQDHPLRYYSSYRAADSFQDMARGLQAIVEQEEPAEPVHYMLAPSSATPTP